MVVALGFANRFSTAQTAMELIRWREYSSSKQTSQVAGRTTGIDAVSRTGFVVLGDGEFAQLASLFVHTGSQATREFCQGFITYDFKDGSSILAKIDTSGDFQGKQTGSIVFLGGTRRFEGISGRGTISCWMPDKWDMYAEVEATYSVSKR